MRKNTTTRFLMAGLALVSVFCMVIFSIQTVWNNKVGAEAITEIGVIYMSGMSEQVATHFGTTIELRLSQVGALVDSVPPERVESIDAMRVALTYSARSRGFEYLAFCTEDGEFDMIFGPSIQSDALEAFLRSLRRGEEKVSAGRDAAGVPVVMMGMPAAYPMADGSKSVALIAGLPTSYLHDTLAVNVNSSFVDYSIIRKDGSFVMQSSRMVNSENYFDRVGTSYEQISGRSPEQYIRELQAAMRGHRDYTSEVRMGGERWNVYCTDLPNSEWFLLLYMSYGTLDRTIDSLGFRWTMMSLGGCTLILGALLLVFLGYFRLTRRQIRDLDEARRTADKARRTAEQASRAKSEFLSNMSHDIRTPMNGIMGMTSIAIANLDNTPQVRSCLKKISMSSQHLLGLINDMLDMSKMESGKLILHNEPVSLREIVQNAIAITQHQTAEKRQHLRVYVHNVTYENVCGDGVRLSQILLNLLNNAVKFTPEGGEICITLREDASPRGSGFIRLYLTVQDNGIGMSPEFQEKIFEAFMREDNARVQKTAGAGLGLTITKHIVDAMNGAIEVESAPDRGSTFRVTLDLEKTNHQEADLRLPEREVLLIDGDQQDREAIVGALHALSLQTAEAGYVEEAVAMLKARQDAPFCAILLDSSMAGAIPAAKALRAVDSKTPLVLLLDGDWGELENAARAAGINGCLSKPLFRSSLYYGLRHYMEDDPAQMAREEMPVDFTGRRVLLAEDNELNQEIASELLVDLGMEVDWAENGQLCVEKFQQSPVGWYHVVLMDLRMPVMSGFEAASAIRALDREDAGSIPIIAVSADAFYDDIQRCLACGMNAHTAKPINMKDVTRLLSQYIS